VPADIVHEDNSTPVHSLTRRPMQYRQAKGHERACGRCGSFPHYGFWRPTHVVHHETSSISIATDARREWREPRSW
jgi:hypothetical protein